MNQHYQEYLNQHYQDSFIEDSVALGSELLKMVGEEKRERWREVIKSTDLCHNSKKAWATVIKLNNVNQPQSHIAAVTPNQVAHQLLLNGKPKTKLRCIKTKQNAH